MWQPTSSLTPLQICLDTVDHPDTHTAALAWQHIFETTYPFSAATDMVDEYVAAMLDSLVTDSLSGKAKLADLLCICQRMRHRLEDAKEAVDQCDAAVLEQACKDGDKDVLRVVSWMHLHKRIVEILNREIRKAVVDVIRQRKAREAEDNTLEMEDREWVMV